MAWETHGMKYYSRDSVVFSFKELTLYDTLIIAGYIADCGEFGGHNEYIKCFTSNNQLYCQHSSDKACDNTLYGYPSEDKGKFCSINKSIKSDTLLLNDDREKYILSYIKKFNKFRSRQDITSNAPTAFTIEFKGKRVVRRDECGQWKGFIDLRDTLYK